MFWACQQVSWVASHHVCLSTVILGFVSKSKRGGKAYIHHSYKYNYKLIQHNLKELIQQKTESTYVDLAVWIFSGSVCEHAIWIQTGKYF